MTTITIPKKELKTIIKESVREILEQESMKLRAFLMPWALDREQRDIEKRYGRPSRKVAKSLQFKI